LLSEIIKPQKTKQNENREESQDQQQQ